MCVRVFLCEKEREMEVFPVIDMEKLEGNDRGAAMEILRDACENWGFFEVLNKIALQA